MDYHTTYNKEKYDVCLRVSRNELAFRVTLFTFLSSVYLWRLMGAYISCDFDISEYIERYFIIYLPATNQHSLLTI